MGVVKAQSTIVRKNSTGSDFQRRRVNLIEGTNIALTVADDPTNNETDVTIRATGGAGTGMFLMPSGALAQIYPRHSVSSFGGLAALSTGRLSLFAIELEAGMTITSITFRSSATALSAGTNQWFALFDASRGKLRVTNDDTSTAWGANANKTLNLSSSYLVPTSGLYYIGICIVASTVPTLLGITNTTNLTGQAPITGGTADTGLTDPVSCPTTATALTAVQTVPYIYVS